MASSGKKKTTMAKLTRERRLRERRIDKQAKKDARKQAAGQPGEPGDVLGDDLAQSPGHVLSDDVAESPESGAAEQDLEAVVRPLSDQR
jgi:hypothetical protein